LVRWWLNEMALPCIYKRELGVTAHGTPRQYMNPGEQEVLLALVDRVMPEVMVEVGVNIGLTAKAVLRHVTSVNRYIGIDVQQDYQFELPIQQGELPNAPGLLVQRDPRFLLILRNSGAELPQSSDVVFIDGDHGRHSVLQDSLWAASIVRAGGMIIWHDYRNPVVQVTEVLDELYDAGRPIYHVHDTWLAFERR
jgi:predicted O-methyltransferase YrrM